MELTFEVNEVLPKLNQAASVIKSKSLIAILSDICFTVKNNGMIITASDGENWVTERADILRCDEDKTFCVSAKDIRTCLSTLTDETVTMVLDEAGKIVILDYGSGRICLPYDSADEFPRPNVEADCVGEMIISSSMLRNVVRLASVAAENSVVQPIMGGVHFKFDDGKMIVNGACHKKIVKIVEEMTLGDGSELDQFTLPPKASAVILAVLDGVSEDVRVKFTDKTVSVSNKDFKITARLLEGNYPNCDKVIPKDSSIEIEVDREHILQALKRIMSIENSGSMIEFNVTDENVVISAEDLSFCRMSEETVKCVNNTNNGISICFDGNVFAELLRNIDDETVTISMTTDKRPTIIRAKDDEKKERYLSMIMPMIKPQQAQ